MHAPHPLASVQVSQTNAAALRTDLQRSALEALIEVRREALGRAFGMTAGSKLASGEVGCSPFL